MALTVKIEVNGSAEDQCTNLNITIYAVKNAVEDNIETRGLTQAIMKATVMWVISNFLFCFFDISFLLISQIWQ